MSLRGESRSSTGIGFRRSRSVAGEDKNINWPSSSHAHTSDMESPPPRTPIINTYAFDSAYYERPASLSYAATPPLDSPTRSVFPPLALPQFCSQRPRRCPQEERWRSITCEPGTPPLDMSARTDTSSLDESISISNEPFFNPTTPLLRHGQPKIHTQTPRSGDRILQGLGIEGLFESDAKPFEGMGLLSRRLGGLETDEEDETSEDCAENYEDDSRLSKTFLREALVTFCHDNAPHQANVDVFSTNSGPAVTSTPVSSSPAKQSPKSVRDRLEPVGMPAKETCK
ncbi:hypothetical protein PILCRDRAFT_605212 [Piloderma croceum F 1598]|uniref:Uncharacterized protein n=1 Tax=Piloderma croceum (strain F 1598) TaxID=765440 RepID=A0A0C3EZC2_PILCF|nr:hypothetical protein PILCRDRAFT_605212 [Piloderma croceum F 1598]